MSDSSVGPSRSSLQYATAEKIKNPVVEAYTGIAERTQAESSLVPESYLKPYNPDDLWQKTNSYKIYDDMGKDDQVYVCQQMKNDLILGSGFHFVCESDADEKIKEDLEIAFNEDPEKPFDEMLEEALPYQFGFSISEKIFKKRPDGSLTIRKLKTTHPDSWLLPTDKFGNIEQFLQRAGSTDEKRNPTSLIHFVNRPRFQNPYGQSDLRPAYEPWFAKRHIVRWYSIFIERAASPKAVAKYDYKHSSKEDVDKIFNIIKTFQAKTALTVPKEIEIEFLEAKTNGEAFIKGINIFNMFIGRCLFMPDLVGFQGGETAGGSFSLGTEQIKLFMRHIQRRRQTIERIVNEHFVKPIVWFNHGPMDKYPKFKFNPVDDTTALEFAKVWIEAVKGKFFKPSPTEINHLRTLVKFPETDEDEIEIAEIGGGQPIGTPGMPGAAKPGDPNADPNADPNNPDPEAAPDDDKEKEDGKEAQLATDGPYKPATWKPFAKSAFDFPAGTEYHKKTNFKALERSLDSAQDKILSEIKPVLKMIFEDLADQITKKKILEKRAIERIETLKVKNKKQVQLLLKAAFREHFRNSKAIARSEIFKAEFATPLPSDEFLQFLEQETFQYVGEWDFKIRSSVAVKLRAAIKDGTPLNKVLSDVREEVLQMSEASIDRYARTKFTEVMNYARVEMFEQSGVVAGYQFIAVLDDRTTEICSGLHEKVFKVGDQPVPPLHFNCRSTVVPITIFEEFKADAKVGSKPIQDFIKDNLGKGFSAQ